MSAMADRAVSLTHGIAADASGPAAPGSEPYQEGNVLDRLSDRDTLQVHYDQMMARERDLVDATGLRGGDVLSVGAGWHPGRHMFPAPAFRVVAVDANADRVNGVRETGRADEAVVGLAGQLDLPDESFDVVLYRLVLHHIAFQGPLAPCFTESHRLLRPGGLMIAIEPGLWHPVGLGLQLANRAGLATALHGTPDDIPLSPRRLAREARHAGLHPQLRAVTYTWRRLPPALQRAMQPLDRLGSRRRAAPFGHTVMLIARKPGRASG